MKKGPVILWCLSAAAVLSGGAAVLALSRALVPYKDAAPPSVEYLPGREALRLSAFGFDRALADSLWLRSIQYFFEETRKPRDPTRKKAPLLGPLAQAITDLDPHFEGAYYYGSLFLRVVRRHEEALDLLEKGEVCNPRLFLYPIESGNTATFDLRDLELPESRRTERLRTWRDLGIEAYKRAARAEDVPPWFPRFFEALLTKRGDFKAILENFRYHYERAKTKEVREYWKDQIRSSFSHQVLTSLQQAIERIRKAMGKPPGEEEFPQLPGFEFEKLKLRPIGRAGRFAAFRTVRFIVEPAGTFTETILYDPAAGTVQSLFRVQLVDRDVRETIAQAVALYKRQMGLPPPSGPEGIEALVASGHLTRKYPHPLDGGYILDGEGVPVSEQGWEKILEGLGEVPDGGK